MCCSEDSSERVYCPSLRSLTTDEEAPKTIQIRAPSTWIFQHPRSLPDAKRRARGRNEPDQAFFCYLRQHLDHQGLLESKISQINTHVAFRATGAIRTISVSPQKEIKPSNRNRPEMVRACGVRVGGRHGPILVEFGAKGPKPCVGWHRSDPRDSGFGLPNSFSDQGRGVTAPLLANHGL
jgi:hypothetical protein